MRRRLYLSLVIVGWIVGLIFILSPIFFVCYIFIADNAHISAIQRVLLYKTNPNDLKVACLFIRDNKSKFHTNPEWYPKGIPDPSNPDPLDPQMPKIIKDLKPNDIVDYDGYVKLEFGGGFYHYGIELFPPGVEEYGTKKLAPNLWFYSEDGKYPPPG